MAFFAPAASADSPPPRTSSLSWVRLPGAESCSGARSHAQAVERRLRRPVFVPAAQAGLSIEGRIERASPAGFRAVITLADENGAPRGTRALKSSADRCDAMDDEIALVLALMIDPDAALAPPPVAPSPPPPAPPPAPAVTVVREIVKVPVPCPPPPAPRIPWRAGIRAGAVTAAGLLPGIGVGAEIRGHVAPPRWSWPGFQLGASVWASRSAGAGSVGASFARSTAFAAVCPVALDRPRVVLTPCVGAHLGALRATGFGFDLTHVQEQLVLDLTAGADLRLRLAGPLFAAVTADLVVPTVRDRFYYRAASGQQADLFRMAPVAGLAGLSVGVELP